MWTRWSLRQQNGASGIGVNVDSSFSRQGGVSGRKGQIDGTVGKGRTGPGQPSRRGCCLHLPSWMLSTCALGLGVAFHPLLRMLLLGAAKVQQREEGGGGVFWAKWGARSVPRALLLSWVSSNNRIDLLCLAKHTMTSYASVRGPSASASDL